MSIRVLIGTAVLAAATLVAAPAFAQDPSLHEVYQAAESGNFAQAQRMMDQVLRDHPNSAKAHFVKSELLAKQGQYPAAEVELNTAERLDPSLSFAKPEAVRDLKARVASPRGFSQTAIPGMTPATGGGIPWGMLLLGVGVVALLIVGVRAMGRRNGPVVPGGSLPTYNPNTPMPPTGITPQGAMGPAGSGIGSGILGGLATGAALGAGMVAGEALAHRFMGGPHDGSNVAPHGGDVQQSLPDNMGGSDFGVADSGSWDEGSGGGGGDSGGDWS